MPGSHQCGTICSVSYETTHKIIELYPDLCHHLTTSIGGAAMSTTETLDRPQALPATEKQLMFARKLALQNQVILPWNVQQDRRALSQWIDAQSRMMPAASEHPTSKQVAFAERLARAKRRSVPEECYRSRELMSRWIDSNRF